MNSITSRLIILLIACAALILGTGMLLDYRLSRSEILQGLEKKSQDEIRVVVDDLDNWLSGIEGATRFLGTILAQREYSQAGLQQMLRDIVINNSEIYGAAIALNPDLTAGGEGFAPYYFRREGSIHYADLAGAEANYTQQDWFTRPVAEGSPVWVEPYFDTGGGEVHMTTFAVPVYRVDTAGERHLYAVVTADVELSALQRVLRQLHLGDNSYSLLLSRGGRLMSTRTQRSVMKHYSEMSGSGVNTDVWPGMFERALAGEVVSSEVECPEFEGRCSIRMGRLRSTGWPIAVLYDQREVLAPLLEFEFKSAVISGATMLLMGLAVYLVISRQTRPLRELSLATENIARGEMDTPLPGIRGDDEVARLVRAFSTMKRDLKTYLQDLETATANRSRLEGELAAAREIQMSMLPGGGEVMLREPAVELWARVEPAKTVGGDLYTCFRRDRQLVLAVGDVSDKGVPAALFMARAMSLIQQLTSDTTPPEEAMRALNNALAKNNDSCMFVTLFLGVLDLDTQCLQFASAGHSAPGLLRGGEVTTLEQDTGPAMGLAPEQNYPCNTLQLLAGDTLAIFTDGIDEAFDAEGEMYGVARFNSELLASAPLPPARAGAQLFASVSQHTGDCPQSDDITLMLLHILAEPTQRFRSEFDLGKDLTRQVQGWTGEVLSGWGIDEATAFEMNLVAEELVTNIQKYSGLKSGDEVQLEMTRSGDILSLESRDAGTPYNPLEQTDRPPLGQDIDSAGIGGLGVHLVLQLTDRQHYRREGGCNVLHVEKNLVDYTAPASPGRPPQEVASHMDLNTTVTTDRAKSVARVALDGALNTDTAPGFEMRLQQVIEGDQRLIVLDMQDLDYISSAGLRVIFKAAKQLKNQDRSLAAANRKPHIDKVFEILKALPDMAVFADERELDDYLNSMQNRVLADQNDPD